MYVRGAEAKETACITETYCGLCGVWTETKETSLITETVFSVRSRVEPEKSQPA